MDEYDCIKKSSLKFKGDRKKKRHKSTKVTSSNDNQSLAIAEYNHDERQEDAEEHGGWWVVDKYEQIRDDVAIEFLPGCYARALGNGSIVLGKPHPPGEAPDEEEIFTAISASTNQIALKSGYGRYLGLDSRKRLMGLSEAIGEPENFLPVFEDDKTALCAYNGNFLAPDDEDDSQPIIAKADKASSYEMLKIRVPTKPR